MKCLLKKCNCTDFNRRFCKNWVPDRKQKQSQKVVFMEIWQERPHVCYMTGTRLENPPLADYFFHVLPKGGYPAWKFEKKNIILTTQKVHRDWHSKGREELLKQDHRWQKIFDLYEQLKQEYVASIGRE